MTRFTRTGQDLPGQEGGAHGVYLEFEVILMCYCRVEPVN